MPVTKQTETGFAELNGTKLYYEVAGEGHPLVLLHGGLVDRRLWDEQFGVFAQHYRVIRYDMRGYGDSGLIKVGMEAYSMRQDLYGLLQFLGVEKTYVIGLSMGGSLATDFTLEHPEMVEALVLVGAGLSRFKSKEENNATSKMWEEVEEAFKKGDIARAVELELRFWTDGPNRPTEQVDPQVRERVRQMTTHNYERPDDLDAPDPIGLEPPAIARLVEIHVPTLIIIGDEDVSEIFAIADILEKRIGGAKRVGIANTAHHLNMEKPAEFNQVVLDFLSGI
ncbi:MAG: alpha/beta hydrolase [Ktedonobacteraceae bacterium]